MLYPDQAVLFDCIVSYYLLQFPLRVVLLDLVLLCYSNFRNVLQGHVMIQLFCYSLMVKRAVVQHVNNLFFELPFQFDFLFFQRNH